MDDSWRARLSGLAKSWLTIVLLLLTPWLLELAPTAEPLKQSLQRAQFAIKQNQGAEAAEALTQALAWNPAMPAVRWQAANLAQDHGEPALAIELLSQGELPDGADGLCLERQSRIGLASPDEAIELLETAPAGCPPPIESTQRLARSALEARDPASAMTLYQSLIQYQPERVSHWRQFAWSLALVDPAEAPATLRQLITMSDEPDPLSLDLINAIETAAFEGDPAFTSAQVGQTFLKNQRWLEASIAFSRSLEIDPDYYEARAYYGLTLLRLDQPTAALEQLQRAHQQASDAPLPASLLSTYWLETGDPIQALEMAEIAKQAEPENPAYTAQLAAARSASGDLQAAQAHYEQAIQLSQGQPEFWRLLADFLLRHEIDIDQRGLAAARQAYRLEPTARTADTLGYAHFLAGNLLLADRYLDEAIQHDPSFAPAHYHLGLTASERAQLERAIHHFQRAVELHPEGLTGHLAGRALERLAP